MLKMTMKIIIMTHIHITILYRNNYLIEIGADIPSETEVGEDITMKEKSYEDE
mgnify:CR=1 FL=1